MGFLIQKIRIAYNIKLYTTRANIYRAKARENSAIIGNYPLEKFFNFKIENIQKTIF